VKRSFVFFLLTLSVAFLASVTAGRKTPTTRADRPPASRAATATSPARPAEKQAETLRKARTILKLHRQTIQLAQAGKFAPCQPLLEKILQLDPTDSTAWYNVACVHSRLGRAERALACLEEALEHGYSDFRHMRRDPDIEPLRKLPGYRKVLARNEEIQRARAERIHAALSKRFGAGYLCEIDHANKLVFATNIDRRTLDQLRRHLTAYAKAQWDHLFTYRFEQYVSVVVPSPEDHRRLRSRRLGGFYLHGQRMLVARQVGMVMTHEFTHALHYADQDGMGQRHPIWIAEGLATLFESSRLVGGRAVPRPNHRLTVLKRLAARKKTLPWADLFKYDRRDFIRKAMVTYPQCRYIMMYLHEKGLLKKWYDAYADGYEDDKTGAGAMEKVLNRKLPDIQADWLKWVRKQASPPLRLAAGSAYIGVRTRGQVDGLRILETVPGGGAEKAGLKPGDVIVGVDGERMIDSAALLQFVSSHKPGDRVEIRYRRDGKYDAAVVTLGRWRGRAQPKPKPKPPTTRPARKAA